MGNEFKRELKDFQKKLKKFKKVAKNTKIGLKLAKELIVDCDFIRKEQVVQTDIKFRTKFEKIYASLDLYITQINTINDFNSKYGGKA